MPRKHTSRVVGTPRNAKGQRICGAQKKRGRGICSSTVIFDNGRCRMHGGTTPSGAASPNFRHGRWSKDLPQQLAGRYAEALEDADLISLRDEIALVDVELGTILAKPKRARADNKRFVDLVEQRRKLAETQHRREKDLQQMVPLQQVTALMGAVFAAVQRHVPDPKTLSDIGHELNRLLRGRPGATLPAVRDPTPGSHGADPDVLDA